MRPTIATVDLNAIVHNAAVVRGHAAGAALCGVVKANAYGHGAMAVGRALTQAAQVPWLAVALVEEGIALREADLQVPILVLAGNYEGAHAEVVHQRLTPVVSHAPDLPAFSRVAGAAGLDVHVEVDTGMARLGVEPEDLPAFLHLFSQYPNLRVQGLMCHLAHADNPQAPQNAVQLARMQQAEAQALKMGLQLRWRHVLNSGGLLCDLGEPRDLVRCGLALYGAQPATARHYAGLRPAMRWTTRPVALRHIPAHTPVSYAGLWTSQRKSRIATLPVGYADGYKRRLTNRAHVLVRGQRACVVGAICMDLCMVDVTDILGVTCADEVVLLGSQGDQQVTPEMLGTWAESFSYEVLCSIGSRVPRHYIGGDPPCILP